MLEIMSNMVRNIVVLVFLAALLELFLPEGDFRRYLRMLLGILLILALLSPLQSFMGGVSRLDDEQWELFDFSSARGSEELENILEEGRRLHRTNTQAALDDYRRQVSHIVDDLLRQRFGLVLVRLELDIEEDPESRNFGAIQHMSVEAAGRAEKDAAEADSGNKGIEEVNIGIELGGLRLDKEEENRASPEQETGLGRKKGEVENFLADYFQLPARKVSVRLAPEVVNDE